MAGLIAFDWRSLRKWFLIATLVMLGWLLWPTAKCGWAAFREEPLPQIQPHDAPPQEEPGFFSRVGSAVGTCYRRTPLFGQESWKGHLFVLFGGLTVLAYAMFHFEQRRKRTFDR